MPVLEIITEGLDHTPSNESATCEWIIVPVLHALGYGRFEVVPRATDVNSQFPDYTVLPASDHTWYLEAKSVGVTLQDVHVTQALNYAHQNGKRWAVLSNGRDWRLYDDRVDGISSDRLVVEASICNPVDLETLLHALGRESVTTGGLERYAANSRLASELGAQLRDDNSEVVRAIWNVLKKRSGLGQVSRKSIVEHFGEAKSGLHSEASVSPAPLPETVPTLLISQPIPSGSELTLGYLAENAATALFRGEQVDGTRRTTRKPRGVRFPDGTAAEPTRWWTVATNVTAWLLRTQPNTPVPFAPRCGREFLVNHTADHFEKGPMRNPREVVGPSGVVYLESHQGAEVLLDGLTRFCEAAGVDPSTIIITLAE